MADIIVGSMGPTVFISGATAAIVCVIVCGSSIPGVNKLFIPACGFLEGSGGETVEEGAEGVEGGLKLVNFKLFFDGESVCGMSIGAAEGRFIFGVLCGMGGAAACDS